MAAKPMKLLVAGDVQGKLLDFFFKIEAINDSAAGPFDALFCVGDFFGSGTDAKDFELEKYVSGAAEPPIPTYIIPSTLGDGSTKEMLKPDGLRICKNLEYLGRFGIKTIQGIRVAYLSGYLELGRFRTKPSSARDFYVADDLKVKLDLKQKVDFFFSSEWPRFHKSHIENLPLPSDGNLLGSPVVTKAVLALKPRYHFTALEGSYMKLTPFKHLSGDRTTRFIALAKFNNPLGQKDIYAFTFNRASTNPSSCILNPLIQSTALPNKRRKAPDTGFSTFSKVETNSNTATAISPPSGYRCNLCGSGSHFFKQCTKFIPNEAYEKLQFRSPKRIKKGCGYCLQTHPKHRLVSSGLHSFLAVPPVQISPNHVILCPSEHVKSIATARKTYLSEMKRYMLGLEKCFKGSALLVFERNIKTDAHAVFQVLPFSKHQLHSFNQKIINYGNNGGVRFKEIKDRSWSLEEGEESNLYFENQNIGDLVGDFGYIDIGVVGGSRFLHVLDPSRPEIPLVFLRQLVCHFLDFPKMHTDTGRRLRSEREAEERQRKNTFKGQFSRFDPFEIGFFQDSSMFAHGNRPAKNVNFLHKGF